MSTTQTDEQARRDATERALARLFAGNDRVNMLRTRGEGRWTAQVLVAGVRRLAVVCHREGVVVGLSLGETHDLDPVCREAIACYVAQMSPRLRHHTIEITRGEIMLIGRVGAVGRPSNDATERQVLDLVAGAIALCATVAEQVAGLCDERVAQAYLEIRGKGGDAQQATVKHAEARS